MQVDKQLNSTMSGAYRLILDEVFASTQSLCNYCNHAPSVIPEYAITILQGYFAMSLLASCAAIYQRCAEDEKFSNKFWATRALN